MLKVVNVAREEIDFKKKTKKNIFPASYLLMLELSSCIE
jgi:hypothetical protein